MGVFSTHRLRRRPVPVLSEGEVGDKGFMANTKHSVRATDDRIETVHR